MQSIAAVIVLSVDFHPELIRLSFGWKSTKKRQKTPDDEHRFLAVRVEGFDAKVEAAINHSVFAPQFAWNLDDDDPLFEFMTRLVGAMLVAEDQIATLARTHSF
ncbi:hypothetical protein [Rhizobium mayense]|uniref:Uncharacterized protein n=1 Tax=Rhizobium mayense TaxID=1312184 RepID=A0ABT7K360_9HYPH|nr:hypothetical protein [Rhizobium mayense]MDL2403044.1 hypothetical protein [Rhizobium mayense]